jgi:hypothetical protein
VVENCSSRTFYINLYRGSHRVFREELRRSFSRSSCKRLLRRISTGSRQDLLTRTPTCNRSCKDTQRVSQRPPQELLTKDVCRIMATRISTRSSHKEKTLTKIFMPGPLRKFHKIVTKGHAAAGDDLTKS